MTFTLLSLVEQFRLIEMMQQGLYRHISVPLPATLAEVDSDLLTKVVDEERFQRKWLIKFLEQLMFLNQEARKELGPLSRYYTASEVGPQLARIKQQLAKKSWLARLFSKKMPLEPQEEEQYFRLQQELNIGGKSTFGAAKFKHKMSYIPCGSFEMGADSLDPAAVDIEKPQHTVYVATPLMMGEGPVSQELFGEVMGYNPSSLRDPTAPVDQVSWFEALQFCNLLSVHEQLEPVYSIPEFIQERCNSRTTQKQLEECYKPYLAQISIQPNASGYRIPNEAEWEYAAQANQKHKYSGSDRIKDVAWFGDNSRDRIQPIGLKAANAFGLHDMSGNVWEWCWDGFDAELYKHKKKPFSMDVFSQNIHYKRCCRGGSYYSNAQKSRVSFRQVGSAAERSMGQGFRKGV